MKKLILIFWLLFAGIAGAQDYVLTVLGETNTCGMAGHTNAWCCMFANAGTNAVTHGGFLYAIIAGGETNSQWTPAPVSGDMLRWDGSAWQAETNITMNDGAWHGIGAALERIEFDGTAGVIWIKAANLEIHGNQDLIVGRDSSGGDIVLHEGASSEIRGPQSQTFNIKSRGNDTAEGFTFETADGDAVTIVKNMDTGVGVSPTEKLQAHGVIALSDTNDIPSAAAGMAKLYVTNSAAELWVIDASGNRTQLSAHDGDIPIERSQNDFTGRSYWRNKWTGEEIKSWILPRDTWAAREERQNQRVEQARATWTVDKVVFDAWTAAEPVMALGPEYDRLLAEWQAQELADPGEQPAKYVKKPTPQWVTSGLEENPNVE